MDAILKKQETLATRISRMIENLKKKGADNINRHTIEVRLELLESYWLEFTSNDDTLLSRQDEVSSQCLYFTNNLYDETEEVYLSENAGLKDLLGTTAVQPGNVADQQQPKRPSLPKIVIQPFDGNYTKWTSFRDLFRSMVIDNKNLTDVERLHYLKTNVTGEPADLLHHIPVTDEDFPRAWMLLEKEYDNVPFLVNAQLGALLSLPGMKTESATELRTLLHGTQNAVEALTALKRPVKHWSDWLNFITVQRLDRETRLSWETSLEGKEEMPPFSQLSDFLGARLRSLTVTSLPACNLLVTAAGRPPEPRAE